jgi:phytoene dehydrogenase-like protein
MGALATALASSLQSHGGEIALNRMVAEIRVRNGRADGVVLADGSEVEADVVLSNAGVKCTFLDLVPRNTVRDDLRAALSALRIEGTGFKINFALSELPNFRALPGTAVGPQHRAGVILAPPPDVIEKGWDEAKSGRPTTWPFVHLIIQSAADPSLAPEGKHTVSLWGHHFPYTLAPGLDYGTEREMLAERMIDLVTEFAPNFRSSIIAREIYTPRDIEDEYGLTGGQIYQGDMVPGRVLWDRPIPGMSGLADPVPGLYLCGAAAHPGGLVSGMPGHNAAAAVLTDLAKRQFERR